MPRRYQVLFDVGARAFHSSKSGDFTCRHARVGRRHAYRSIFLAGWLKLCARNAPPTPFRAWLNYSIQIRRPAITVGISRVGPPASGLRPSLHLCPRTPKRGPPLCSWGNITIIKGYKKATGKGQVGCSPQERQEEVADFCYGAALSTCAFSSKTACGGAAAHSKNISVDTAHVQFKGCLRPPEYPPPCSELPGNTK